MDHDLIPTPGEATPAGLTRREVMRRGALLGGAVIAAQSLGAVSALAQTSPPPPPPPPGGGSLPSNFQIIVNYAGTNYGVKYDGRWDRIGNGVACDFATPYQHPTPELLALLAGSVTVGTDGDGHVAYLLNLPAGVTFVEGRPFDGTCQAYPGADDKCGAPAVQQPDGRYAFPACD